MRGRETTVAPNKHRHVEGGVKYLSVIRRYLGPLCTPAVRLRHLNLRKMRSTSGGNSSGSLVGGLRFCFMDGVIDHCRISAFSASHYLFRANVGYFCNKTANGAVISMVLHAAQSDRLRRTNWH